MPITVRGETFDYGLSIVVPVYRGAGTIGTLVAALSELKPEGGIEIILVNDGSPDHSGDVCRALARSATVPGATVRGSAGSKFPPTRRATGAISSQ